MLLISPCNITNLFWILPADLHYWLIPPSLDQILHFIKKFHVKLIINPPIKPKNHYLKTAKTSKSSFVIFITTITTRGQFICFTWNFLLEFSQITAKNKPSLTNEKLAKDSCFLIDLRFYWPSSTLNITLPIDRFTKIIVAKNKSKYQALNNMTANRHRLLPSNHFISYRTTKIHSIILAWATVLIYKYS